MTETFVEATKNKQQGWKYQTAKKDKSGNIITPAFYWQTPALPAWALPDGDTSKPQQAANTQAPAPQQQEPQTQQPVQQQTTQKCEKCGKDKITSAAGNLYCPCKYEKNVGDKCPDCGGTYVKSKNNVVYCENRCYAHNAESGKPKAEPPSNPNTDEPDYMQNTPPDDDIPF